jgi:hypothetical protein
MPCGLLGVCSATNPCDVTPQETTIDTLMSYTVLFSKYVFSTSHVSLACISVYCRYNSTIAKLMMLPKSLHGLGYVYLFFVY